MMYKIARVICNFFIWIYCKIVYRAKVIGTENIPKNGAVIFCANHKSFLDPPLLEVTCKRRDTRFVAKEELTKNKFLAFLGKVFDVILVKRNDRDFGPMKESLKTLKEGKCLAIFPEGTRNGLKKGLKPKTGVAYFALNSNATVIPVGIKGGEKPFDKMTIRYGEPMDFSNRSKDELDEITEEIMEKILELAK